MTDNYNNLTVSILGSTGSVGTQAACVAKEMGVKIDILAAGRNTMLLSEQARLFQPNVICVADEKAARELDLLTYGKYNIIYGADALEKAILESKAEVTVHSIAGLEGTRAALAAARTGTRLAMANKEAIIAAGDMIKRELALSGGVMVPVDSEHSAIFQCLQVQKNPSPDNISRILLTASGGPFFGMTADEMKDVTPERALAHPTWKMGPKITVDSATLMNKGFEVMEAVRLFDVSPEKIEVVVHRQSIIHSMVEYIDNSVIAQLAAPDMRSCIRYAMSYPERARADYGKLDFTALGSLTFEAPDIEAFPLLALAYDAIKAGGTMPTVLIAADEVAVDAFLKKQIGFGDIAEAVRRTLDLIEANSFDSAEEIYEAVARTKETALGVIASL